MKTAEPSFVFPSWPAPASVNSAVSLRKGGVSGAPYDQLNVAHHVGDDPNLVEANRLAIKQHLSARGISWMNQVHGTTIVEARDDGYIDGGHISTADACWTANTDIACAVMTADCLPLLVCDRQGTKIAAIHAGWRGLCAGIISKSITEMRIEPAETLVWLGPAIGPAAYQVGREVKDAFAARPNSSGINVEPAFTSDGDSHYLCDLYELARIELNSLGVTKIYGGDQCTYSQPDRYYSYRRDGQTGRMVSLIWLSS